MGPSRIFIPTLILLLHLLPFAVGGPSDGQLECGREQMQEDFLGLAAYFIGRAQINFPWTCPTEGEKDESNDLNLNLDMDIVNKVKEVVSFKNSLAHCNKPVDCADVFRCGQRFSGVYSIRPKNNIIKGDVKVYCDMDTDRGGWTVIQRRGNYGRPKDFFFKDWKSYKNGFGDIEKDFWLGNDVIFAISNQKEYSIRFDLVDFEGATRHAHYDTFRVQDERRKYALHIDHYSGNVGDAMHKRNNMSFSTKERDNDKNIDGNCAERYNGGWWYNNCYHANLNGLLYPVGRKVVDNKGVIWGEWKGWDESLTHTEMKIRGLDFSDQ